ncbi:TerB family tellurite resistance protein [Enterovirga rhinocerotis]|uniref:Tellurite resistance protein TerB n=1 Tax=Enterovirga rhinocerotis TaxID=1339210 RepID=A0A4R7C8J3_9HYPH|nr:TerB family tellurite resistance protein [Enterovirga rhinocerotis]TDR94573.1 tellurite resistance protein TerB [Enterovirga rhinocerotis]
MVVIIGVLAIVGGILIWVLRAHSAVTAVRDLDRDTKGLRRRIRHAVQDFAGGALRRINDPRLAAAILMIQLVRAEGAMSAEEKTEILDVMETKLGLPDPAATFEKAWGYTEPGRPFSIFADELLPLFRKSLDARERDDLVGMLRRIAAADAPPSDLQGEAVIRLKKRLRS